MSPRVAEEAGSGIPTPGAHEGGWVRAGADPPAAVRASTAVGNGRTGEAQRADAHASCPHCGVAVEGERDAFCCPGCAHAWEIIHGAGLDADYERREALPPRPVEGRGGWETVPPTIDGAGRASVQLQVDGLRCAACVWVTERVLTGLSGVDEAHVSYATGRARLRWDPDRTDLPTLAGTIEALGYRPRVVGEGERWDRGLLLRLGFAAFATVNIMLLSASLYAGWASSMDERFVALFSWTALGLATPLALWAAAPFFSGAWAGLRQGVLHMDLPIALAITVLYGHAVVVATVTGGDAYLDSLGMLITLLLAGRVLEGHGRRRTAEAALSLAAVVPAEARRIGADGAPESIPTSSLEAGDRVLVGPGREFPADGRVVEGRGSVALALLTGESRPVEVQAGDEVFAGALLLDGAVEVEVTAAGEETVVRRMAEQVRSAADRATEAGFADRLAPSFTALTLLVAGATALGWGWWVGVEEAIRATVAVLVVACPCALALAHPLVSSAGIGALARRGLLVRGPEVLTRLAEIDRIALDKTGTVTEGTPKLLDPERETLRVAAALERYSAHPIARAILDEAIERGIPLPAATDVVETPGVGVEGELDGHRWRLGRGTDGLLALDRQDPAGWTPVGSLRMEDRARTDARAAFDALAELGVPVTLLTGDDTSRAREVAAAVGADDVHAECSPEAKAAWLEARDSAGDRVLFAGDGLNDGPALATAHVGVAMGSGVASSILAADGVVAREAILPIAKGIRIARWTADAVRRAQLRSIAYNVVAVAAAAAGLVNPLVAAILMSLSSSLVLVAASGIERRAARAEAPA